MTKDELNELHEWLLSAAGDASPYESQMLMKAATIVGEKFSVEPPALPKKGVLGTPQWEYDDDLKPTRFTLLVDGHFTAEEFEAIAAHVRSALNRDGVG